MAKVVVVLPCYCDESLSRESHSMEVTRNQGKNNWKQKLL